jgi:hypothetical protein
MIDATDVPRRAGRLSRVAGCWPRLSHGGIMRIRRTIAPLILTIGAIGSLVAAPAVAAMASAAPAAATVATGSNVYYYHT